MNVCVAGLWHLGTVTAGCLASIGHNVRAYDDDQGLVSRLNRAELPVAEKGLREIVSQGFADKNLGFYSDRAEAMRDSDVLWITCDTPVDDSDNADVEYVMNMAGEFFPLLRQGMLVIVSSQLPVGSTRRLASDFSQQYPGVNVNFACIPENLRLGNALNCFLKPDRFVAGLMDSSGRERIVALLAPITDKIEWMGLESAEMTKHAINAFLATSIAFANEIAVVCESYGADAKEVERGLKTESRIGPKAYLSPGSAFAGGTLARDIGFLSKLAKRANQPIHLLPAVRTSNDEHRGWARRKLVSVLGSVKGKRIALWGLTYKPGTDTLRRSMAVELARWLSENGASVAGHDPALSFLPDDVKGLMTLASSPQDAASGADALVVSTEWPVYRDVDIGDEGLLMHSRIVIDANRFLETSFGRRPDFFYYTIGKGSK